MRILDISFRCPDFPNPLLVSETMTGPGISSEVIKWPLIPPMEALCHPPTVSGKVAKEAICSHLPRSLLVFTCKLSRNPRITQWPRPL